MTNHNLTPLEELRKSLELKLDDGFGVGAINEALLEIEKRDLALAEANKEVQGLRVIGLDPEIYNKRDNEIERLQSQVDVLSYRAPTESAKLIKELQDELADKSKLLDEARTLIREFDPDGHFVFDDGSEELRDKVSAFLAKLDGGK